LVDLARSNVSMPIHVFVTISKSFKSLTFAVTIDSEMLVVISLAKQLLKNYFKKSIGFLGVYISI